MSGTTLLDELIGWKRLFIAAVEQKFRNRINLIAGTGVSIAAADNATEERTDVTIAATGTAGHVIQDNGDPMTQRTNLNIVGSGAVDVTITDVPGTNETKVEISASTAQFTTAAGFTMPAVGSTVSVDLVSTAGLVPGATLYLTDIGYFRISSVTDGNTVVIENLGDARNVAPSTVVSTGITTSIAGGPSETFLGSTVLTAASGTFTTKANTKRIRIRGWGGGGGGGGAAAIVA